MTAQQGTASLLYTPHALTAWRYLGEPPPEPLSEAELSWIWAGQRFPEGALRLVDGRRLRVLNPGRPGGAAGPDFLDAVFDVDGRRRRGDVELHLRASGFSAHGHDSDHAYDEVALHVVFRADTGAETRLPNGKSVPVAELSSWLDGRSEELRGWLAAGASWREPCHDAGQRLGEDGVREALRAAGLRRFEAKREAMRRGLEQDGAEEVLWRSLLEMLGAGGERGRFRQLAQAFPAALARQITVDQAGSEPEQVLAQALLFIAGLVRQPPAGVVPLPLPLRPALNGGGRPANSPQRRLAAAAALHARAEADLARFTLEGVRRAGTLAELQARWQVGDRWGRALVGTERARELVLNVVLPFAALNDELRPRAMELLAALRASPPYGKTLFLERNLAANEGKRPLRSAVEQQGLLWFLEHWCSKGGCGRCALSP